MRHDRLQLAIERLPGFERDNALAGAVRLVEPRGKAGEARACSAYSVTTSLPRAVRVRVKTGPPSKTKVHSEEGSGAMHRADL